MNKCYYRIVWENYPSDKSPVNEQNLNKVDVATDELDNRVINLDANKFDKAEAQMLVKYIEYDENTGIFKVTHYNGSSYEIDTLLEKLAINFDYDYQTQRLIIELSDGTVKYVDLSALITQYEFLDSNTVRFTVDSTGKVKADIVDGSIQEKHLRPNYLADIKVVEEKAKADAAASAQSAKESDGYAKLAKSYAVGTNGEVREGDATDNAKCYYEQMQDIAEVQNSALDTKVSKAGDTMTGSLEVAGTVTATKFVGKSTSTDKWATARNINGMLVDGSANRTNYGTCSTAAATAAKTVACDGFSLMDGAEITVKFTVTNTAANPTLNVNGTGAKPIYYRGVPIAAGTLARNRTYSFRYNGEQYEEVGDVPRINSLKNSGYVGKGEGNPNKVWGTDEDGNPGWRDKTAGSGGAVTGVKGGAESRYRIGNVDITPANVGAVSKAGDTVVGHLHMGNDTMTNSPNIYWDDKNRSVWAGTMNGKGAFYIWDATNNKGIIISNPGGGDNRFLGTANNALRLGGMTFHLTGQSGQPQWVWGANSHSDTYVWNPSNFRVANANTCADLTPNHDTVANTIVTRDAYRRTHLYYIGSSTINDENPVISQVIVTNGADNYYRKASLAHLKRALNVDGKLPLTGGTLTGAVSIVTSGASTTFSNAGDGLIVDSSNNEHIKLLTGDQVYIQHGADQGWAWAGCSAGGFFTISNSSARLKNNIEDITVERASQILRVKVVTFDYKDGVVPKQYQHNRSGVIAEQTESVCPEVINYEEGKPTGVQYDRFIPYLIKMLQIQQEEINELKSDKQRMEERLTAIEEMLGVAGKDGTTLCM